MNIETSSENNQFSGQISPIGPRLRHARETLRLTTTDIARQLRLTPERIELLENDDYQSMPGIIFIKGYLRAYARLVNLPADSIIADFERLNPMPETKSFALSSHKSPISLANKSVRRIIYLMGIGLLVLVAIWWNSLLNSESANLNLPTGAKQPIKNAAPTATGAITSNSALPNTIVPNNTSPSTNTNLANAQNNPAAPSSQINPQESELNKPATAAKIDTPEKKESISSTSQLPATDASEVETSSKRNMNLDDSDSDEEPVRTHRRSHPRPRMDEPFDE